MSETVDSSPEAIAAMQRRLAAVRPMIGAMCSQGRPPAMSVPADRERDEDLLISDTADAAAALLAQVAREREEAVYLNRRMEEARAKLPDWEKLWSEESERADAAEHRLAEARAEAKSAKERMWECGKAADAAERQLAEARAALLNQIRRENHCHIPPGGIRTTDDPPQRCDGWDAEKCGCAIEARALLPGGA